MMRRHGLSAESGRRRNATLVATAASASSLAYESRLRRPERRRCVLTPADVVRDTPTILPKKIEELREVPAKIVCKLSSAGGEGQPADEAERARLGDVDRGARHRETLRRSVTDSSRSR